MNKATERITLSLPKDLNEDFEELREKLDISRSDAIRKAMRSYIIKEGKKSENHGNQHVLGTITYLEKSHIHAHPPANDHIHEHPSNELKEQETTKHETSLHTHDHDAKNQHKHYYTPMEQLEFLKATEIQHSYLDVIVSTLHVHASSDSCMLVIAVEGGYERINSLLNELKLLKTIENIQFSIVKIAD